MTYESVGEKHEPNSPSQRAQILNILSRRRKSASLTALSLITLCVVWMHTSSELGISEFSRRPIGNFVARNGLLIPPKIWQIMLPMSNSEEIRVSQDTLPYTTEWLALNPDYQYILVGEKGANDFIQRTFGNQSEIVSMYRDMGNVGMKSDLMRYLILGTEGGVYTDTDTIALQSINDWVPPQLRQKVRLVVGIEYDQRHDTRWPGILHSVQLCQWTIAAAPNHPVFPKMVERVLDSLSRLVTENGGLPLSQIQLTAADVLNSTGPAAWTDVVFEQLKQFDPRLNSTKDLSSMKQPTLFGDILVLPINGFGMGQWHSGSTNDGTIPKDALIQHKFKGSWRKEGPEWE